ncbi:MAG: phosphorylase family protein [Gammaproteobacteria bacterium]
MISVGLIVALPAEQHSLTRARIRSGRFSRLNENTLLCLSGIGPENAAAGAARLVEQGCEALLSWGCAGAIATELRPGDLIIPERVLGVTGETFATHCEWRTRLTARLGDHFRIHDGALRESQSIVASAADKRSLHEQSGALAVDMESAAIARLAFRKNLPFVTIRAIVDPADMDLPEAVSASVNPDGELRLPVLLAKIARQPASIFGLIRLGHYFRAARRSLQQCALHLEYNFSPDTSPRPVSR